MISDSGPRLRLHMMTRLAHIFLLVAACSAARAEVRRALVVGIDNYLQPADRPNYQASERTRQRLNAVRGTPARRTLDNLDGAVNDAQAMRDLLVGRYGFEERNVVMLPNPSQEATADNILKLLASHLIESAKPGDVSLFYYAGHGSRIRNTSPKNQNPSGMDSTIIPADAPLGVPDIRSKELAAIFARAPAKNIALTVILDSCYSGGAARGAMTKGKVRSQPPDGDVAVDEPFEGPLPEDQGVLVISASQDYEPAAELRSTDLQGSHGAFTWSLLHVLAASAVNESVDRIFQRARALMQSKVPYQEPVLLAKNGRNQRGLLGQPSESGGRVAVAVNRVLGDLIKINGGLAMNLREGCELKRVVPAQPALEIRITRVNGLGSSDALISKRAEDGALVQAGDLFELNKWVTPDRELMRVYVGAPAPQPELDRAVQISNALRNRGLSIQDPTVQPPTHVLAWDGEKSKWRWRENKAGAQPVWMEHPSADAVARLLGASSGKPRVFVWIPPPDDLIEKLRFTGDVSVAATADLADYVLLGRPCQALDRCVEYAWALPDSNEQDTKLERPLRSDWIAVHGESATAVTSLTSAARSLARVVGWLDLRSPALEDAWPYRLALESARTKQLVTGGVEGGGCYKLLLQRAPGADPLPIPTRRVYVFVVDSFGKAALLFGSNLENEFPRVDAADAVAPELIPLTNRVCDIDIAEPYGTDNYFLLASGTPIDNPETVFNFSGARNRGEPSADPLARLLQNAAAGTRGAVSSVPVNWSIQHSTFVSRPAARRK